MSFASGICTRGFVLLAALSLSFAPVSANDAAHKLAEKFAHEGSKSEASPAEETEAQRRAAADARKKEAERLAQEQLKEEARLRAEAALKAERERHHPPVLTPTAAPAPDAAQEEADMLARARAEAEQQRKAEGTRRSEDETRRVIEEAERASRQLEELLTKSEPRTAAGGTPTEADRAAVVAGARRVWRQAVTRIETETRLAIEAEKERAAVVANARRAWRQAATRIETEARLALEAEKERAAVVANARRAWHQAATRIEAETRIALEAERARAAAIASARRIFHQASARIAAADRMAAAEAERARVAALTPPPAPPSVSAPIPLPAAAAPRSDKPVGLEPQRISGNVTILIVLQPGTYGIRKHNKSADPVLCTYTGCYVGAGPDLPAIFLPGRRALGFTNTLGGRAGACSNQLGCVFRAIPVAEAPLLVQPVDMHVLKHDRRQPQAILTDSQCGVYGARLSCSHGIYADDYVIWVLPESLAETAGPDVLLRAIAEGLNGSRSAAAMPR